jgi:hypothetical protein
MNEHWQKLAQEAAEKISWLHDEYGKTERAAEIIHAAILQAAKKAYKKGWNEHIKYRRLAF